MKEAATMSTRELIEFVDSCLRGIRPLKHDSPDADLLLVLVLVPEICARLVHRGLAGALRLINYPLTGVRVTDRRSTRHELGQERMAALDASIEHVALLLAEDLASRTRCALADSLMARRYSAGDCEYEAALMHRVVPALVCRVLAPRPPLHAGTVVYRVIEVDLPPDVQGPHTWEPAGVVVESASDKQIKLTRAFQGLARTVFKPTAFGRLFFETPQQAIRHFLLQQREELAALDRKKQDAARALAWAESHVPTRGEGSPRRPDIPPRKQAHHPIAIEDA